ncbi:hypothetical protein RCXUPER_1 [Rhodobacter phage RcXuper]|nr:hypothetical protein RCXUPER_1 [Rhodobacter phage RcXuper]
MSRHTDAANAAQQQNTSIDWSAVSERGRITSTEEFRREYMCEHPSSRTNVCEPLPLSFAG